MSGRCAPVTSAALSFSRQTTTPRRDATDVNDAIDGGDDDAMDDDDIGVGDVGETTVWFRRYETRTVVRCEQ